MKKGKRKGGRRRSSGARYGQRERVGFQEKMCNAWEGPLYRR